MRIPKIDSKKLSNEKERLLAINYYVNPSFDFDSWQTSQKSYVNFVKKIERIVRNSLEYRDYLKFLKEEVDMNQCSFFQNLNRTELHGIGIEIHHAPLTLFDITSIVLNKKIREEKKILDLDVAEEVLKLHYKGMVGLIPLSLTVHELVHSGEIFIPINKVYGNIQSFYEIYKDGFTEEQIKLLKLTIETSSKIKNYSPSILEKNYTYLQVEGFTLPKLLKEKESGEK